MENLKAIANIVKGIRLKASDLLTVDSSKHSKTNLFYNKIINGDFKDDHEAAAFFYQSDPNNSNYKNLKSSLREKLANTVLFYSHTTIDSGYAKAMIYCTKYMAAGHIMILLGARAAGTNMCKKVLKKAQEYELTDFILRAATFLQSYSIIMLKDEKKFEHYNQMVRHYSKVKDTELLAAEYYYRIVLPYSTNKSTKESTTEQAKNYHKLLKPHLDEYQSPYLHLLGYYIESTIYFSNNDYQKAIDMCERAIHFFESKPYTYNTPIKSFMHDLLLCYIQIKEYDKGKVIADRNAKLIKSGSYNWYINQELILMLSFHSKKYQEGLSIVSTSLKHRKFKNLSAGMKEKWIIYEAYIHFLIFIGKIEVDESLIKMGKFRQGKFLNSTPLFSKDKRGMNIPVLIVQILFMIVKKDYDQAIDRIEAIEKYCSRYLRKDENFRSNCFIKALLQVPISDFHRVGVERRAKKYLMQLKSIPLEVSNQPHEVEIIPYEDLWDIIMASLETKFYKVRT